MSLAIATNLQYYERLPSAFAFHQTSKPANKQANKNKRRVIYVVVCFALPHAKPSPFSIGRFSTDSNYCWLLTLFDPNDDGVTATMPEHAANEIDNE